MPESFEFREGRIAYLDYLSESDNPYLTKEDRGLLKEQWSQQAQDWFDGWCTEHEFALKEDM